MKFSPDSITRAIRIAQAIGSKIDPAFGTIPMFKEGEGAPLERDTSRQTQDVRMPMNYPQKFSVGGRPTNKVPDIIDYDDPFRFFRLQDPFTFDVPKHTYASGGEVDDHVVNNPMSVFPKPQRMWDEDKPGGAYLSMPDKEDVTGHKAAQASIGIGEGGKPYFHASRDKVDETGTPGKGSALVKTNLFKQKAGWKWKDAPEGHEDTNTIVSVEHRGNHHYVLGAHFPNGVDLARYPDASSEPRLRPTTRGNVELGPQVGSILVRGREHPVHSHAIVREYGGRVDYADGGAPDDRQSNLDAFLEGNHPLVPNVVYHGTDRDISEFDTEKPRRVDAGMDAGYTDTGWYGKGHYFTPHKEGASHFASDYRMEGEHGPNVMPVHLSLKNPFIVKVPYSSSGATDMDRAMNEAGFAQSSNQRLNSKGHGERLPSEQTKMLMDAGHDGVIVMHQYGIKDPEEEQVANNRKSEAHKRHNAAKDAYYEAFSNRGNESAFDAVKDEYIKSRHELHDATEASYGDYHPHEFVAFKPHQIKSAIGNSGRYDLSEPHIGRAAGGALDDDGRELNDFGLYSHAAEQAGGLQKTDSPKNYKDMLMKLGVKPAEIEHSGYDQAFADQPQITREQVAEHFQNNMPQMFEVQYGDDDFPTNRHKMLDRHAQEYSDYAIQQRQNGNYNYFEEPEYEEMINRHRAEKAEVVSNPYEGDPFHRGWTIPGGKNYREILLKHDSDYYDFGGVGNHFGGSPNIAASLRLKDREDADGNKILHLEELQSDWGQAARKHGFYDADHISETLSRFRDARDEVNRAAESEDHDRIVAALKAQKEAKDAYQSARSGVQRAPYIDKTDNWVDLGLKRALLEAAQGGHDKLSWTPGDVQADRYSLSKHIKEIHHQLNDDGTYNIIATGRNNSTVHDESSIPENKLAGLLGKEMAEKIISRQGDDSDLDKRNSSNDWRKLSGLSLDVGGEGMKTFYDQMLPKRLLKLARMHDPDAEFSKTVISHPRTSDYMSKVSELPSLNITQKMRDSILKNGFAAHADGGAVEGYDNGGGVDDHPLTNPVYHGTTSDSISSPLPSGLGMEMFEANHPSLNYNAPNVTALALGPHVARDPNISGDIRFTTGEQEVNGKRVGFKPKGHVALLNTFPDEKFFPVEQSFDDFGNHQGSASSDDQAVHNTVYADVFQNNPKLTRKVLRVMGKSPEHIESYVRGFQSGEPFEDPLGSNGFKWPDVKTFVNSSTIPTSKNLMGEVVKDFRKRMRDKGYVGLSYINTDLEETKNAKDKKCYIVFPQRDKETGWYPMRFRQGAAYNPADKGKPGLHLATGGEADGMEGEEPQAAENPNGGLMFSPEANAARLQAKTKRDALVASGARPDTGLPKNPRTVIKAPEGSDLPDFATGNINFDDWRKRHEQILNDDEIHHSSQWYKNIYGNFQKYYPEEADAKKMMRAWLVAQQNVSPAGAMNNVLMQQEQMDRGDPVELWRAGGMPNPTAAARSVLAKKEIKGGVGQKISDFVDSAEGKSTRSWMGDHPDGGSPFVVDVHTARDTGVVDQELINHLTRLGYDPEALSKLKIDMTTSPSEPMYENRAQFGRDLTDHLNQMGWKGRKDWTPDEIQAIGWMGMTKLTRNAEEDSESGLGRNLRRISYELSPGEGSPWEAKYGKGFESLPDEDRYDITKKMADSAMEHAQKLSGINVQNLVHGTGAWENYQNPAAVTQSLATQRGADIAAAALGHMLQQTEVWHNRVKPMSNAPKGFALDFIEKGSNNLAEPGALRDFWGKVMEADPHGIVKGYQPITLPTGETGLRALFDKGGKKTQEQITNLLADHEKDEDGNVVRSNPFRAMLESQPFDMDVMGHEAEITKHRNDWKAQKNGEGYISRLVGLLGYDPSAKLNIAGQQLEKEFGQHLDEAHKRQGTSWREAPERSLNLPKANGGAINKAILIAMRAKKRSPVAIK